MKSLPFIIPKSSTIAVFYQEDNERVFYDKFHQHEEIQISYIEKGEGTLILADNILSYQPGDLVVINSNIPHLFKSDLNTQSISNMKTLFFTPRLFGSSLFELSDFSILKDFIENLRGGVIYDRNAKDFQQIFSQIKSSTSLEKMILFLDLVGQLQNVSGRTLSTMNQDKPYSEKEGTKMRDVMNYTFLHFKEEITLKEISAIGFMTPNAFCRYFKKKTNKSYFQFLIEIRINQACKLLWKNPELTVEEILIQSGFSNASNFYRQFKTIVGKTPLEFRMDHK